MINISTTRFLVAHFQDVNKYTRWQASMKGKLHIAKIGIKGTKKQL